MKIAYLDCASGISGDMTLAALVDAGVPLDPVQNAIDSLGLPSCRLELEEVKRKGFRALKLYVHHDPEHRHRHLSDILEMIETSALTKSQRQLASTMFQKLGEAEAHAHGVAVDKVHFHEVGAVDSIADLVGSAIAFDLLGADRIVCSPIPTGYGTVKIAHGLTSVPAPATAELLKGAPLAESEVEAELTTPTGAVIATSVADSFGCLPPMTIESIGYGAGTRDFTQRANILRVLVGQLGTKERRADTESDEICVLETNLDDATGEVVGYVTERLLAAGALDVYTTPIQMKKNRPAVKLTVLAGMGTVESMEEIVFRETTTIGIRRWQAARTKLPRENCEVPTRWGQVRAKRIRLPDGSVRVAPEYDSCRERAERARVSLAEVIADASRSNRS